MSFWSRADVGFIRDNFHRFSDAEIARALSMTGQERTASAVASKRRALGCSHKPGPEAGIPSGREFHGFVASQIQPPPRPYGDPDELDEKHWRRCVAAGGFAVATPKGWYWPAKGERAPA